MASRFSADAASLTYGWDFGDGSPAGSGASVSHTYASAGSYVVTLTVTDKDGGVGTSDDDRDSDSEYNTYKHSGLPPTPIMAPGEQAIEAALKPADGPWLYFVTTNPDTGVTKFAEGYDEHLQNKQEFDEWCASSANC